MVKKKIKIFLGVIDAANVLKNFKKGLEELSIYDVKIIERKRKKNFFFEMLDRLKLFCSSLNHDIYVFTGYDSFFQFYELWILRILKKKIIVIYLGSDARSNFKSGKHKDDLNGGFDYKIESKREKRQIGRIKRAEKYSNYIINHTATSSLFSRKYVKLLEFGIPINNFECNVIKDIDQTFNILHAPTRPSAKGSSQIKHVVDEIRSEENIDISLICLTNVSREEVLREIDKSHLVIDELYSDTPIGMLGAEAVMKCRPVLNFGYYSNQYLVHNDCPFLSKSNYFHPTELKARIKYILSNYSEAYQKNIELRSELKDNWCLNEVTRKLTCLFDDSLENNYFSTYFDKDCQLSWGLSFDELVSLQKIKNEG